MLTEIIERYVAEDGTPFEDKEDCVSYEKELMKDASWALKGIPHHMVCKRDYYDDVGDSSCYWLVLVIRNEDEANRFNKWYDNVYGDERPYGFNPRQLVGETIFVDVEIGYKGEYLGDAVKLGDIKYAYDFFTEDLMICRSIRRIQHYANLALKNEKENTK